MSKRSEILAVCLSIMFSGTLILLSLINAFTITDFQPVLATQITERVNEYRESKGLAVRPENGYICDFATARSVEISTDFSHDNLFGKADDHLLMGITRIDKYGENLSMNYNTAELVVNAWINSPTHKAIMEEDYDNSCVKCYHYFCVLNTVTYRY